MISDFRSVASRKLHRGFEAAHLILSCARDQATRRELIRIYSSLADTERYSDRKELHLRTGGRPLTLQMRMGDIFVLGEIFHEQQYRVRTPLPSHPVIVDAGANIGVSALWFLARYPDARLFAFEPAAENFALLAENLAIYENAAPYRSALGRRSGTAVLRHGDSAGTHSLMGNNGGLEEPVPVQTLERFMEDNALPRIDLLKLDVEGSELEVLKGLGDRIRDVGVLIGEVHESIVDEKEFYDFLADHGFRVCSRIQFRESKEERVHGFEAARRS